MVKLSAILCTQFLLTTIFCLNVWNNERDQDGQVKEETIFKKDNMTYMKPILGTFLLIYVILVFTRINKWFPVNYILLIIFTFCVMWIMATLTINWTFWGLCVFPTLIMTFSFSLLFYSLRFPV